MSEIETAIPNPDQLRSLWNLAVSDDTDSTSILLKNRSDKWNSLKSALNSHLPEDVFVNCSPAFKPMLSQYTLRQLLTSPVTPKDFWKHLKRYFKKQAADPESVEAGSPMAMLYYAVIAADLVYYGEKISKHSWKKLEDSFRRLADRFAADKEIAELFQKASISCRNGV
jgi:hypothetical protein